MKTILPLVLLFPVLVAAGDQKLAELVTLDGKFYQDVTIRKVEPDGLSILHQAGTAKVPFEKLPGSLQEKYGYNAEAAAEHRKRLADAQGARETAENAVREKSAQAAASQTAANADKDFAARLQKAATMLRVKAFQNSEIGLIGDIDVGTPTTEPVKSTLGSTVGHKPAWSYRAPAIHGVVAATMGARMRTSIDATGVPYGLPEYVDRYYIGWEGKAWRIGMIEYQDSYGLTQTMPLFTASETEAAAFYKRNGFGRASENVTERAD